MSNTKFQILVADPAWGNFKDKLKMSSVPRSADANYPTMSTLEIQQLPISSLADPDGALLALWVPSCLLQDGLDVMKMWGFKHKQTYIWVKVKKNLFSMLTDYVKSLLDEKKSYKDFDISKILLFGMGRLYRQSHEICLIGINNNKIYKRISNKSQRSVSFGENLGHSTKPEHLQDSLDLMFPDSSINKIELFARRKRKGWLCLGNEVCNNEDIRYSINNIL